MQINKISQAATKVSKKVGEVILSNKPSQAGAKKVLEKANKFLQGESYNPGRGAYYLLMGGFVIAPRLLKAREPDEFREILTRDTVTVLTILFAMKGLQSGMCNLAQKKSGLVLVKDLVGKDAKKLQRLKGYLNPEGGILPLGSDEIAARYSRFNSKESFVKCLKTIDEEGGNIGKIFSVENKSGIVGKIKKLIHPHKDTKRPLFDAANKLFGEDFTSKSNEELIKAVENISTKTANEGLEEIIGSKALNITENAKEGILTSGDNPITTYARSVSAKFNTLSLGITAGFLGFGLSKFNEIFTNKKHLNQPATNPKPRTSEAEKEILTSQNVPLHSLVESTHSKTFHNFMGTK